MKTIAFKNACHQFAEAASSYLIIKDDKHYQEVLELIESFLEESEGSLNNPLNAVIDILAHAVKIYENQHPEISEFERSALNQPPELAMLRLLMNQHNLGMADIPEIGSKSMVSRVLSGERELSKKHIKALSKRFNISPSLFF